jgi:hypothetical protein
MSDRPEVAILAEAGLRDLKSLRRVLIRAGIESHIMRPPAARNT